MQACLTEQTASRSCYRVVGRNHDIEFWGPRDDGLPLLDHHRPYYPDELYPSEKCWLPAVLGLGPIGQLAARIGVQSLRAVWARQGAASTETAAAPGACTGLSATRASVLIVSRSFTALPLIEPPKTTNESPCMKPIAPSRCACA